MKRIILILTSLLLILISVIGVKEYVTTNGITKKAINIDEFSEEMIKDFNQIESVKNNYHSEEELDLKDEIMFEKNQDPEYVTNFFFASAVLREVDLFSSVFEFEQYNVDLFLNENPDKHQVVLEMMERITREDTLNNLKIISVKKHAIEPTFTVEVLLFYKDEKVKSISLELITKGTSHEYGDNIFFIKTSAWDIVSQIEEG